VVKFRRCLHISLVKLCKGLKVMLPHFYDTNLFFVAWPSFKVGSDMDPSIHVTPVDNITGLQ
jgi:hypothetical protein